MRATYIKLCMEGGSNRAALRQIRDKWAHIGFKMASDPSNKLDFSFKPF